MSSNYIHSRFRLIVVHVSLTASLLLLSGTASALNFLPPESINWGAESSQTENSATPAPELTAVQIVEEMAAHNLRRENALRGYKAIRNYHVEYKGFPGDKVADLQIEMTYQYPHKKEFRVVSETGSGMLRGKVLKKLLEAEKESAEEEVRLKSEVSAKNYEFKLVSKEMNTGHPVYVLDAIPKEKSKFSFKGKIWIDGNDFAIMKIEGEPGKNPSWWTTQSTFDRQYAKVGDFWLPARNEAHSKIRMFGGRSSLVIEYKDYKLLETRPLSVASQPNTDPHAAISPR